MRGGKRALIVMAALCLETLRDIAAAQSAIAGVVKDTTGAVLPGVTVEASSPSLIEKVRTAATDDAGQYKILALPPGTYTVTFTLTGFSTVKHEGIVLTTSFTAPVNAEMKVGALEETVTVTGASPVVDIQSATQQQQLTRETLDVIPTGRNAWSLAKVLPGIVSFTNDVGGSQGIQQGGMTVHGSKGDISYTVDGMNVNSPIGNGTSGMYTNDGQFEEFTYETSAIPAESGIGGIRILMTPREGGNTFKGYALVQRAPWTSGNFTPELKAAGLRTPDKILELWDTQLSLGGPIKKDRLWFFATHRYWGANSLIGNSFFHERSRSLCGTVLKREPDFDCQGIDDNTAKDSVLRLTWQASKRNKVAAFYEKQWKDRGHREIAPGFSPEATRPQHDPLAYSFQIKWTAPITSRVLWESGISQYMLNYTLKYRPEVRPTDIPHVDLLLQQTWSATPNGHFNRDDYKRFYVASLSYVTGSHAFKTGFQYAYGMEDSIYDRGYLHQTEPSSVFAHIVQEYRTGAPASVIVDNTPVFNRPRHHEFGVYVQDSWTVRRLTINPGLRYDYFRPWIEPQYAGAGRWVPERRFDKIDTLPSFENVSPRLSMVYDLFANAKTAIKGSIGGYVSTLGNTSADTYNPLFVDTDRRTWNDLNGDDIAQNNEIGPSSNRNFGLKPPRNPDPNLKRPHDWEYTASVQQEVLPRLSARFVYIRRRFVDLQVSRNRLLVPGDYTPIAIPDPRGNGQQLTVYNLNRDKLGLVDNIDTNSDARRQYWSGIELTLNGRIGVGGTLYGGLTMGGASQKLCDVDDPNQLRFCERSEPWRPQVKIGGAYLLPWDFRVSGTFSSFPGGPLGISYIVNRSIIPTLTQAQVSVPLDNPSDSTRFLNRLNQLDVRFGKTFEIRQKRLGVQFDVFNALNTNVVLGEVTTWGPALGQPRTILQGRLFQVGTQLYF